jgi:Tfp pilus assembly protein PilF
VIITTLGIVRKDMGDLDQATKDLTRGVRLNKKNLRAYLALASVYETREEV